MHPLRKNTMFTYSFRKLRWKSLSLWDDRNGLGRNLQCSK